MVAGRRGFDRQEKKGGGKGRGKREGERERRERKEKKVFGWFEFLKPEFIPFSIFLKKKNFLRVLSRDFDF